MKDKIYEMDDDYKKAAAFLVEQIVERDEYAEQLKLLSPEERPKGLRLLAELDKAIERGEQALANKYETHQNLRRAEDERDEAFNELLKSLAGAYVHVKYRNPEMLPQLEATIADMPPDEAKVFYDCTAQIESGDLIRIIAREGETREQTEEFLKTLRAAAEDK